MKVRWGIARVACISNVAKYVPGIDDVAGLEAAIPIEVRVVVQLSSRADDVDDFTSEPVRSDADDNAFCGAEYRRSVSGKDVDTLM